MPRDSGGFSGPASRHREMICDLELPIADTAAFVDALCERVREGIITGGCQDPMSFGHNTDHVAGFNLHYRRDAMFGSILVYLVRIDQTQVRLVAILDEHRAP